MSPSSASIWRSTSSVRMAPALWQRRIPEEIAPGSVSAVLSRAADLVVAMEACASAHEWGRAIQELGHDVRLIPPSYVKPYVKRQKNDTADAEAIAEAGSRQTRRFVAVKTAGQQARSMVFQTRDLLVRQRTQLINALRGHLAEHGIVAPQGPAHLKTLAIALDGAQTSVPQLVRNLGRMYLEQIEQLRFRIAELEKTIRHEARCG